MLLPILTNIRQIKTYSSSCISWTAVTLWRLCRWRDWTQIRWCWIRPCSITTNAIGLHRSLTNCYKYSQMWQQNTTLTMILYTNMDCLARQWCDLFPSSSCQIPEAESYSWNPDVSNDLRDLQSLPAKSMHDAVCIVNILNQNNQKTFISLH